MKTYIALALFCLSTGAIAGEVSISPVDGASTDTNPQTNDLSEKNNAQNDMRNDDESVNTGLPNVVSTDTAVAVVDPTPISSPGTSYTASDGITYGLEPRSMGDGSVQLNPKQPNVYEDRAYVEVNKSSATHTPFKRPEIELGVLVGGSGSYIPVNETLIDTRGTTFTSPAKYKFQLSGEGFSGGGSVGASWRRGNNSLGAFMTGYLDTHTLKNYDHKDDVYSDFVNSSMTFLSRSYTLEFATKAGRYFGDVHFYGKLGFMCSAFQYKYRSPPIDRRKNITAWGGVAGIGLQTPINFPLLQETKVGLEYNYQIYETLTPVVQYSNRVDTAKLRPRYHNGYLTLSKTF